MEAANVDSSLILFSIWTESLRHMAENGKGNSAANGAPDGRFGLRGDFHGKSFLFAEEKPPVK